MIEMDPNEGALYPGSQITQTGIGALKIEAMAFGSEYPSPHIRFCHEITLQDASTDPRGWGNIIFKGTLKELINLVGKEKAK